MSPATDRLAVLIEEVVQPKLDDHESRIRSLESLQAKLFAYALVGSLAGGAVTQVVLKFLVR